MVASFGLLLGFSHAAVISFEDLNTDITASNTLNVGGVTTGIASTGSLNSGVYTYSVDYSADFGAGIGTQTLSFDVVISAITDSVVVNGTANTSDWQVTLGTTVGATNISNDGAAPTWRVDSGIVTSDENRMASGETLIFDLQNVSITGGHTATALGFDGALWREGGGSNHRAVVGLGTGLFGDGFGSATEIYAGSLMEPFYVTGADQTTSANRLNWGVQNVDFDIDVTAIPEPSTAALFALGFGCLCAVRRKK